MSYPAINEACRHDANRCQEMGRICIILAVVTYGMGKTGSEESNFLFSILLAISQLSPMQILNGRRNLWLPQLVVGEVCHKVHHWKEILSGSL